MNSNCIEKGTRASMISIVTWLILFAVYKIWSQNSKAFQQMEKRKRDLFLSTWIYNSTVSVIALRSCNQILSTCYQELPLKFLIFETLIKLFFSFSNVSCFLNYRLKMPQSPYLCSGVVSSSDHELIRVNIDFSQNNRNIVQFGFKKPDSSSQITEFTRKIMAV